MSREKIVRTCGAVLAVALAVSANVAFAADNGPTQEGQICMQKVFGTPVTSANKLNCTANDIRLSRAISVSPTTCQKDSEFTLTATFETVVTANSRYDAGFFFRIDGGANARGDGVNATGLCSLSALTPGLSPALNLDGDTAGDLNSGTYNVTFTIPHVKCVDTDNDGFLNLPNCTSWHNNQGTIADITDAFDFNPDTKSKCVCDDKFQVPVTVEDAKLTVTKTAAPTTVPESGGNVTYTVVVTNDASSVSVTIQTIQDSIYGDLADATNANVTNNTCPGLVGDVLAPGGSATCTFEAFASGNAGDVITDVVEVCGPQTPAPTSGTNLVCDDDDATVTVTNEAPNPSVTKTANAGVQTSCSVTTDVTYSVTVSNPSLFDSLTVNSLTDDIFGDVTSVQGAITSTDCGSTAAKCQIGSTIAPQGSCSCSFVARTTQTGTSSCSFSQTDTVTADLRDTDAPTVSIPRSDDATVSVTADVSVSIP